MQVVNIKEACARLSSLVDMAEKGETVVITRNGKESARLGPMLTGAKALPCLEEFRARIVCSTTGLSETIIASRRKDRL